MGRITATTFYKRKEEFSLAPDNLIATGHAVTCQSDEFIFITGLLNLCAAPRVVHATNRSGCRAK